MPPTTDAAPRNPALEAHLKERFKGCCLGGAVYAYDRCDSTMERAHELARQGIGEGAVIFAARQEQGRGRLGRRWESPEGGAYFSLILKPTRPSVEIPQLSLVIGLSVAEAIAARPAMDARSEFAETLTFGRELRAPALAEAITVRWPNDVLLNGKKVAGILTEARGGAVVVGIGINVSTDPKELPDTATSLQAALEKVPGTFSASKSAWHFLDPLALVALICRKFDGWYDVWTAQGFAPVRQALRPWMSHVGGIVRLTAGSEQVEGQAVDLDESGRLLVRLDSGIIRAFDAGEVTLLR